MHRQKQGKLRPSWNSVETPTFCLAREGRTGNPHTNPGNASADQETARCPGILIALPSARKFQLLYHHTRTNVEQARLSRPVEEPEDPAVRIGPPVGKRALAASHLSADPQLMRKAGCGAMPPEETDSSTPGVRDLSEDDLGASAHSLTGRDEWDEYIQKKTYRFRLDEAKGILASSTCLHSQEEKQCLSEAADRLQSSSAVLESFAASIPANRLGEYYRALWEFGNANHDIGVFTKFSPAAFERSKRDLNASRGKRARHGKTLKRAFRPDLDEIKRKAVEDAIAARSDRRFKITKDDAKQLCPDANGNLRQQASSMGIELEDKDLLTPNQTLKLLSDIRRKKKSGL
jgi:hypothetical protein